MVSRPVCKTGLQKSRRLAATFQQGFLRGSNRIWRQVSTVDPSAAVLHPSEVVRRMLPAENNLGPTKTLGGSHAQPPVYRHRSPGSAAHAESARPPSGPSRPRPQMHRFALVLPALLGRRPHGL